MVKAILKDACILFAITLISGLMLGAVHYVTEEPIKNAAKEATDKACKAIFADADRFDNNDSEAMEKLKKSSDIIEKNGYSGVTVEEITAAYSNDELIGYIYTAVTSEGYGGNIKLMVGISADGNLMGYEILSIEETPGLGMKAKESEFKDQFKDRAAKTLTWTKAGASKPEEVDAISGATITTKAVTGLINAVIAVNNG